MSRGRAFSGVISCSASPSTSHIPQPRRCTAGHSVSWGRSGNAPQALQLNVPIASRSKEEQKKSMFKKKKKKRKSMVLTCYKSNGLAT